MWVSTRISKRCEFVLLLQKAYTSPSRVAIRSSFWGSSPNKRQEIPCVLFDRTTTMRRSNTDCKRTRECSRVMFAHSMTNLSRLIPSSRSNLTQRKSLTQNLSSFGAKPLKIYRERDFKTRAPHERATRDDAIRALIRALKKALNATTHHFCCFACVFLKAV